MSLLPQIEANTVLADKRVLEPLAKAGKTAVIPSKRNRNVRRAYDKELYKPVI